MANYLTAYVEFLGLPGCGKSYFSHKVAETLRAEGYRIAEPSWELDHTTGKYVRAIKKTMMAWLFTLECPRAASRIKAYVNSIGINNSNSKRFLRNILYKVYLLKKRKENVFFFDEGIAQVAVSMSVCANKTAGEIYNDIMEVSAIGKTCVLVNIDCSIERALQNMDLRTCHDSHVEQLSGLDFKKDYLNKYKTECNTIFENHSLIVPYSQNTSGVVQTIVNFLKIQLERTIIQHE